MTVITTDTIVTIVIEDVELTAELRATATSKKILDALPIEGQVHTWGEEIYFEIHVDAELEDNAVAEMAVGALAYWPPGRALCIFFGPTPVSDNDQPRAYSPVNEVGKVLGDVSALKKVRDGTLIKIKHKH